MLFSLVASAFLIWGAFWFASLTPGGGAAPGPTSPAVTLVDGTQYIDISAKGGYSPRIVDATAGIPTVLRVSTRGTFDCSSSLVIPKLSYQKFLSPTETEEIAIAPEKAQGTLQGLCSMGMYNFQIRFK
jgi:Cu+-exporting ATPase